MSRLRVMRYGWRVTIPRVVGSPIVKEGETRSMAEAQKQSTLAHGADGDLGIGSRVVFHDGRQILSFEEGKWKVTAWRTT